ncbi:putative reverse transcriptase domain-containing protein [Tanacetum coccineum]
MAYHPQMDGQSERAIQTLEGILEACVIDYRGRWGVHLPLAELSYNNSYHSSIQYALFEALYGRKCRSLVLWAEIGESSLTGFELVQETTDKVVLVKEKPKAVRDRQKSYVDYRRKSLEFEVGDRVLLRVSPWKGVVHFGKNGKLALRYVGPFEILKRISLVSYRLRLPEELNSVHDKCLADANLHVPLDEIKVRWNSKHGPEFTWEREDYMKSMYPQLFVDRADESARGSPAGIDDLFCGWYCGLASRKVTLGVSMALAKGLTTGTLCFLYYHSNLLEDKEVRKSG